MKNKALLVILIGITIIFVAGCSHLSKNDGNISDNSSVQTEYSEKENVVMLELEDGKIGEEITATLSVSGTVDMCAVNAKIYYDTSKLKLTALDSDNPDVIMNEKSADGTININFMRIKNVVEPFGLCNFVFEVITDEMTETVVSADIKEVVKVDGDEIVDCPYSIVNGTASLNGGKMNE